MPHLTSAERETVIRWSDAEPLATITTHQRAMLTKLRANPAAVEVDALVYGSSDGARFTLPKELVSLRSKRRTGGAGNPDALRRHRQTAPRLAMRPGVRPQGGADHHS